MTVAWIGTGVMGAPMARNLARAGVAVRAWNRTAARVEPLRGDGVMPVETVASACAGAEIAITMLADDPAFDAVFPEIVASLPPGALIVDMGTTSPAKARANAAALAIRRIGFVDAPVSGGERGAIEATLAIMAGGELAHVERAMPLLRALGTTVVHVGGVGAGQAAKACNQLIVVATIEAVAESLALAAALGADPAKVRDVMLGGFARSRILDLHGTRMIEGNFEPGGALKYHLKDRAVITGAAAAVDLDLPVARAAFDRVADGVARGLGERDHSVLFSLVQPSSERAGG